MKKLVLNWLVLLGILFIIISLWQNTEILLYGVITPRILDSIISVILAFSLFSNISNWVNKEN